MPNGPSLRGAPAFEPKFKIDIASTGSQFTISPMHIEAKANDVVRWRAMGDRAKIKFSSTELFGVLELTLEPGQHKDLRIKPDAARVSHPYEAYMGDRAFSSGGVDPDIIIR